MLTSLAVLTSTFHILHPRHPLAPKLTAKIQDLAKAMTMQLCWQSLKAAYHGHFEASLSADKHQGECSKFSVAHTTGMLGEKACPALI